ncbi:MAG: OB-fold domain-containing protein [Sphingobium sp.]
MTGVALAEGIFRDGLEPRLIGGRHRATGRIVFPCPADPDHWEEVDLPSRGTLWSWTIQRFRPKTPPYTGPEQFDPFAIGYVELPSATIVESRLEGVAFDALRIGMPLKLTIVPFTVDSDGRQVMTFAFAPDEEA